MAYQISGSTLCGLCYLESGGPGKYSHVRYLPLVSLSAHARILSSVSRTTLTQTFVNPDPASDISEVRYTFPLYDGVSIVGFTCTINNERVIHGVVKEKQQARQTFKEAISRGETASLLEQLPEANDVFTTIIGNIPANATVKVDIVYLGELKHDAEVDGIRYTIPTRIAPRYGSASQPIGHFPEASAGISITVDVEMQAGSAVSSVQSLSHPIVVTIGSTSSMLSPSQAHSSQMASATLSLGTTSLDKDFILQIVATNLSNPVAILETHTKLANHRALLTTLVPKFNLPSERPEIVFVCDRSGSMAGQKMENLKSALQMFLKSLPLGVKFNICSFGSGYSFLFPDGSRSYDSDSLNIAMRDIQSFQANYGGTEMLAPLQETLRKRYKDMDLEVFVLTDGEVWQQEQLFNMFNAENEQQHGAVRVFTLGIGDGASYALIEGLARAGNGFAQTVRADEKMEKKVVRMLKAALTTHVKDYTMEIKYRKTAPDTEDDFELIDRVADLVVETTDTASNSTQEGSAEQKNTEPISLFDPSFDSEATIKPDAGHDPFSDVPYVASPRIFQTPCQVPPLFPFSRTNIYLLLGPETSDKIPETVILRGTTRHGPLELAIPVTIPTTSTGDTVHQLAARNAVKELEEGRGWIFHAKSKEGVLLKKAHQGRFPDMVQREAVRLSVQFQVASKWCSFVAVESSGDGNTVRETERGQPMTSSSSVAAPAVVHGLDQCRAADRHTPSHGPFMNFMNFGNPCRTVAQPQQQTRLGGLFGSISQARAPPAPSFSTTPSPHPDGRLFGSVGTQRTTTSVFGGSPSPQGSAQLFGGLATHKAKSLFGNSPSPQAGGQLSSVSAQPKATSLFGNSPSPQAGGQLSSISAQPKATSLFGNSPSPQAGGQLSSVSAQPNFTSLFGSSPHRHAGRQSFGSLAQSTRNASSPLGGSISNPFSSGFGVPTLAKTNASGGGLFGVQNAASDGGFFGSQSVAPTRDMESSLDISSSADSMCMDARTDLGCLIDRPSLEAHYFDSNTKEAPLDQLVRLQTFAGSWQWTDFAEILEVLGGKHLGSALANILPKAGYVGVNNDTMITVAVVAFLRNKMAAERDLWELLEEKTMSWLETQPVFGARFKAEEAILAMEALWEDFETTEDSEQMS